MRKSLIALVLALSFLLTVLAVPVMAEEKPAGWNNVNAEGYVYPDYTGEKLRFMWWGSDTRAKITTEVIEMYEKLTGLDIEYEFYDGTTYWTVFQAYQAANDLPDVFQMGNNWLTYYDTVEPLNSYIESGVIDTTAISPAMLATTMNMANGDVTGISNGTNARCFAYNPAIFDEAGVAYPTENWTWDDFYEICRKVTKDTGGKGVIDQFGTVSYTWYDAFDANGVNLFDEKGRTCDFTVREIGDAIAFLEKLEGLSSGYAISERNFSQGNVAFQPMLFSEYRAYKSQELSIKKYSGFEWECVTMPAGPSGDNYSRLDTLSIAMSEKTAQKENAWEFMKILTADRDIQFEIFEYSAGISVLPEVSQSPMTLKSITESTGSAFNMDILKSAMEKTVTTPRFRGYDNALEEVGIAVDSILESRSNIQMEQIIWNRTINNYLKSIQIEQ